MNGAIYSPLSKPLERGLARGNGGEEGNRELGMAHSQAIGAVVTIPNRDRALPMS